MCTRALWKKGIIKGKKREETKRKEKKKKVKEEVLLLLSGQIFEMKFIITPDRGKEGRQRTGLNEHRTPPLVRLCEYMKTPCARHEGSVDGHDDDDDNAR